MSDLHARLKTVIEEMLAVAGSATSGPWNNDDVMSRDGVYATAVGHYVADCRYEAMGPFSVHNATFIAAHDPVWAIRQHEAALRQLDRHWREEECTMRDCLDVEELAEVYGVPIDVEDVTP